MQPTNPLGTPEQLRDLLSEEPSPEVWTGIAAKLPTEPKKAATEML